MPVPAQELEALIKAGFPDAQVTIVDTAGDQDHYSIKIVAEAFRGISRVEQHRLVQQALGNMVGGRLHAMSLQTEVPKEAK